MPRIAEVLDARPVAFPFMEAAHFIGLGKEQMQTLVRQGVFTIQRDTDGQTAARFFLTDELTIYRGVHRKSRSGDAYADVGTRIARVVAFRRDNDRIDDDSRRLLEQHKLI